MTCRNSKFSMARRTSVLAAQATLFAAGITQAATVTRTFHLNDLDYFRPTARIEVFGGATTWDVPSDMGALGVSSNITAFDEGTYGRLTGVTISMNFSLRAVLFATLEDMADFGGSTKRVTGDFRFSDNVFIYGTKPHTATETFLRDPLSRDFSVSTDRCTVAASLANCVTRDAITLSRSVSYSFAGANLEYFRGLHRFGTVLTAERLGYTSNVDSFRTGIYLYPPTSPAFDSQATYRITYHTSDMPVVPLPASAGLLLAAIGALGLGRRSGRSVRRGRNLSYAGHALKPGAA